MKNQWSITNIKNIKHATVENQSVLNFTVSASRQEDFAARHAPVSAATIYNSLKVLELRQNLKFCSEIHKPLNSSLLMKNQKV